jgi:uncharacterized protein (UPF0264 family)
MPQLLISVTSIKEAQIALECGADIIDLKDPEQGALGALPLAQINEIIAFVNENRGLESKVISATIGDLPMEPDLLLSHVLALSKTEADIIKIGFFRDHHSGLADYQSCLDSLMPIVRSGVKLVAVLFVEYAYPADLISAIKNAGFYGVMLDTTDKNGTTFLDYFTVDEIKGIANNVQAQWLLFGLAGSLNLQHVTLLREIAPDYIGFRGGVCVNHQRKSKLDPEKIRAIRKAI